MANEAYKLTKFIREQARRIIDSELSSMKSLGTIENDGRYNSPSVYAGLSDLNGSPYHIVGFNAPGDRSVAAP